MNLFSIAFVTVVSIGNAMPVIDTVELGQYKRAQFESHETGWFGLNAEWAQRIYMGETEGQAALWMSQMQTQYYKQKVEPIEGEWDEGLGNAEFMMVRIENLGLLCQGKQAALCIDHLKSRIVDTESSCPAPTITKDGYLWTIQVAETDCHFMFQGGQPIYDREQLQFSELPATITIYNRYAMSWKYRQQGINSYVPLQLSTTPSSEKSLK